METPNQNQQNPGVVISATTPPVAGEAAKVVQMAPAPQAPAAPAEKLGIMARAGRALDAPVKFRHVAYVAGAAVVVVAGLEVAGRYSDAVPCFGILKKSPTGKK